MMFDLLLPLLPEWLGAVAVLMFASLSPRFKRPPLVFKYARRDGMVALSLFALIMALGVVFIMVNLSAFQVHFSEPLRTLAYTLLVALVSVVPFIAAIIVRKQPWRSTGWNRAMLKPSLQLGPALAFLTIFLRGKFNNLVDGLSVNELNALWMWLMVALAEETIFRGYLQLRFTTWWGQRVAWLGTAGLFIREPDRHVSRAGDTLPLPPVLEAESVPRRRLHLTEGPLPQEKYRRHVLLSFT